ncbi:UDP-N-acetylglucosamine--dolichyl-phosphate N-acetylglucosaminephosphotransferase-like [Zophobas morio]|uniref:UDP-N-acetylglucosamine--dolichyl-phosphate N-acetylglucosaminephosphotransferase-like n=1 Tax=Zophobas morio TaxID=2755281 RepID=UPI003082B5B7
MTFGFQLFAFCVTSLLLTIVVAKSLRSTFTVNLILSSLAFLGAMKLIPSSKSLFLKANCVGIDVNKLNKPQIPESIGLVVACCYFICMGCFLPFPFKESPAGNKEFFYCEYVEMVCGLLSICYMVLLGFVDDILELRWRDKLVLPAIATLPLLLVYHNNGGSTYVSMPSLLRPWFGGAVDLGYFYYLCVSVMGVFCTNAINILSGVNGLEAGQSENRAHYVSLFFMMPFVFVTLALTYYNWFPAEVFVGDTFCYFAGMTFAVAGILGHFTKTLWLFFIPQLLNFIYSVPQLLRLIPCPRHRMPRLDESTGKLINSFTSFKPLELSPSGRFIFNVLKFLRLAKIIDDGSGHVRMSNLTLINFFIYVFGSKREDKVTASLLLLQVMCSFLAIYIRYGISPPIFVVGD